MTKDSLIKEYCEDNYISDYLAKRSNSTYCNNAYHSAEFDKDQIEKVIEKILYEFAVGIFNDKILFYKAYVEMKDLVFRVVFDSHTENINRDDKEYFDFKKSLGTVKTIDVNSEHPETICEVNQAINNLVNLSAIRRTDELSNKEDTAFLKMSAATQTVKISGAILEDVKLLEEFQNCSIFFYEEEIVETF